MYIYQITNKVNGKVYIGQTNNIQKRWSNHKNNNDPNMVIARAIRKYGIENFDFRVLLKNLTIEEANEKEKQLIIEKNSLVPNGYNVAKGGKRETGIQRFGAENSNAHLTEEEAQFILDHRNLPIYILYEDFNEKISYEQFKKLYHHKTYTNLTTSTQEYPYNTEFSAQFSGGGLEYDEVCKLRERYAKGDYWRDVYKDYKEIYENEWSFWNVYNGNSYKLVMPEVFTKENKKKHSSYTKAGILNGRAKLKEQDVLKIRELNKKGIDNSEIYKLYPQVTKTTIRDIIDYKTWKHLL